VVRDGQGSLFTGIVAVQRWHVENLDRRPRATGPNAARPGLNDGMARAKAKFHDHVRSNTDVAMVNEVLCKLICHNICCRIQARYELGILPASRASLLTCNK